MNKVATLVEMQIAEQTKVWIIYSFRSFEDLLETANSHIKICNPNTIAAIAFKRLSPIDIRDKLIAEITVIQTMFENIIANTKFLMNS